MQTTEELSTTTYPDTTDPLRKKTPDPRFDFYGTAFRNGVTAGALMGLYLIVIHLIPGEDGAGLKFIRYVFLAWIIATMLSRAKAFFPPVSFFKSGISLGLLTSIIAGLTLFAIHFVAFLSGSDLRPDRFTMEANSMGHFLILGVTMIFEVLVYGMVITFVSLQYLKYRRR